MMLLEHKLKQSTETYHDTIEKDYACFIKLDDDETMFYNSHFSGKVGVAMMYKKSLCLLCQWNYITCYDTKRIVGIKLDDHNGNLYYIIGAYLPSDVNVDTYIQELIILENLYTYYSTYGKLIIAGDFKGSLIDTQRTNPIKAQLMLNLVSKCNLCIPNKDFAIEGKTYSFIQKGQYLTIYCLKKQVQKEL